jgi:hypothetical protein
LQEAAQKGIFKEIAEFVPAFWMKSD